ncbi:uncharacterized protein LOC111405502 isoform X2 [Olea europaea var. sylvestris]|uniref:uncharacterized protein LOC111405502 isoform X2 n=1 Tax=Olea europaea var. sylvestris TaxID=158386 RepID=UPI000C1D2807|nr:uncharacterized protein LOC111405502 isoform X2 [Olea europaea var. sylvestris]
MRTNNYEGTETFNFSLNLSLSHSHLCKPSIWCCLRCLSSIDTICGTQIPIYHITIISVSNYTSMSSLVPISCHCYGGTFYRSHAPGESPFMKYYILGVETKANYSMQVEEQVIKPIMDDSIQKVSADNASPDEDLNDNPVYTGTEIKGKEGLAILWRLSLIL